MYSESEKRLFNLQNTIQRLNNQRVELEKTVAAANYKKQDYLISTAWYDIKKNIYYLVIDINPANKYMCTVLSFSATDITQDSLKNNCNPRITFSANDYFDNYDFSVAFGEVKQIQIMNLIQNQSVSIETFYKKFVDFCANNIYQIPQLCKNLRQAKIKEIEKKEGEKS